MRTPAIVPPASVVLLFALAGWIGCGSTIVSGTGGVAGSTASAGPASVTSSAHAASASSGGTGGQGGGGQGGGVPCIADEKACDGGCVAIDDPTYGCALTGCSPCPTQYPNATPACLAGACALGACDPGFLNCDGDPANGCETNVAADPANCGACGAPCAVPHATPACVMGTCAIATCDSGWTDCNNDPADGCEANLENDPQNCGACGMVCSALSSPCQSGVCSFDPTCVNCPGDPPNVCATTLGTNKNCNFCGDICNLPNSTSQCMPNTMPPPSPYFVCTLQSCNAGFADCDMVAANGCEIDTDTDPNNCGACGHQCPTPSCSGGVCGP